MATETLPTVGAVTNTNIDNALALEALQFLSEFLKEMHEKEVLKEWQQTSDVSRNLLEKSIQDTLAKLIQDYIADPITYQYKAFINFENTIKDLIRKVVDFFLKKHSNLLDTVYFDELYYCLVLKEDTLQNRTVFNRFLFEFETATEYFKRFPIYFQFIPVEFAEGVKHLSTVELQ